MSERRARPPRPWWLSGPAVAAMILLALPVFAVMGSRMLGLWKPFYVPSEAMMPTLVKNDHFIASMTGPGDLRRGDVIVFAMPRGDTYVKRVAALAGDRIELVDGQVYINRRPVEQHFLWSERIAAPGGSGQARRLAERFPGEAKPHEIYDTGYSELDDFPETIVKPGNVFVLGDNRDMSADSRVPMNQLGVEQLPIARILGKPLFHTFFSSKRVGKPI